MVSSAYAIQTTPPTPDQRAYGPRGGAAELWYAKEREILIEGPAGTGKSRGCLEKLHRAASKYAGMRGLIIRKTRTSCTESVLVTFEDKVLPEGSPVKAGPDRAHRARYTYPNGSAIIVGGMDLASRIMSTEYDLIYVPEATELTEDEAETLMTRLRNGVMPYQQIIFDCNPAAPSHWLNQRALHGQARRLYSRHEDNPTVTPAYLDVLRALTGARRARLYEGRWAAQEGLVYAFDPAVHEITLDALRARGLITEDVEWHPNRAAVKQVVVGQDWGYTNPGVLWVALVDADGRAFLVYEVYQSRQTIEWWQAQAVQVQARFAPDRWVADPSEPAFILGVQRALNSSGGKACRVEPANNEIAPGINRMQQRLQIAGDGQPRLYLLTTALQARDPALIASKRPVNTREELDGYHWPKDAAGKEVKEVPVKADDHGMDTIRYIVSALDGPRREMTAV